MSTATCPKCHRQVSLPVTDDHSVWVRCPLCSGQYSLRTALDHVPPALEILGPAAGAEMAAHDAMPMHGELGAHADTLAHPEHAASLAPLDEEHFQPPEHGSNGEQPVDLDHASASEHPPALPQSNGLQQDISEHLVDFDLDTPGAADSVAQAEHAQHAEEVDHLEHDAAAAGLGEYHGEHTIEPSSGESADEGDPEFRFSEEGPGDDAAEEEHAMGGIATLVQAAPPAKKRRQAPLVVKLIGVLLGLGFGLVGCYLVYGAFVWMGSDQFHLKQYFPTFISKHVPDASSPARHDKPVKPAPVSTPEATPTTGTAEVNPAATPSSPTNAGTAPNKPASADVAQQSPVETSEDPLKTPPPDLDKPTKSDASGIAPPKFEPPATPFDDVKPPVPAKSNERPSTDKPTGDKPVVDKPSEEKPVVDKASTDKPATPTATQSTEKPPEKVSQKPVVEPATPVRPTEVPTAPVSPKSPIAAQLDSVDAAIAAATQTAENLKSAAASGADSATQMKASGANYKAMSHLVTELGAVDAAGANANSAARIEQLKKKAAALADPMGSATQRATTAIVAAKWIAWPSRKENGVVVVGTLVKVESADKGFVARIKMQNDSKEMTFTTAEKPTAADGSTVIVLGLLNGDGGGSALEIVSPTDEKAPAAP
jgi:hypothetical protein